MSTPIERLLQVQESSRDRPKPRKSYKPLPEPLKKLTRAEACSGLVYRYERDPVPRSVTFLLQVKVAYGVRIPHDSDELFLFRNLNIGQLREFCSHLGLLGLGGAPIFFCLRALYVTFTKDPIDRSLMPFQYKQKSRSGRTTQQSASVPFLTTTAMPPSVAFNPSAKTVSLPQFHNAGSSLEAVLQRLRTETNPATLNAVAASSMQPFQTFNNTAGTFNATVSKSNLQRFVPARIQECPNGAAAPSGNHNHSRKIKRESLDHTTMELSVMASPSEIRPMESSEDDADRLVLTFLPENNDESSDAEVETSFHPWFLVNRQNNATLIVDEIEALVHPLPTPTQNNRASTDPREMETSVPEPFLSGKNHGSPDRPEDNRNESPVTEVVDNGSSDLSDDDRESPDVEVVYNESPVQSEDDSESPDVEIVENGSPDVSEKRTIEYPDLSENNSRSDRSEETNDSPDMSENNSSGSPDEEAVDRSSEPTNERVPNPQVPEEKTCLQSLEQQQQQLATEKEDNGMLEYFKQNLDVVHDIRKEDLSLRKEDLELRRQDLTIKRKRNLQDAMNQTLQNYMNPACPTEVKDALIEQWRLMDAEFKSI